VLDIRKLLGKQEVLRHLAALSELLVPIHSHYPLSAALINAAIGALATTKHPRYDMITLIRGNP
jgi:hypothetical protein